MEILNSIGQGLVAFIFVLGVMIFIHELGHHLVAKWLGVRVETFSLGFGPRLFGFRMGGTDYRVSALPLGGYVKMAGEHITDDLTGASHEFLSRPKWQRFLVALAGPVMNLVLAVVLLAGNFMAGVPVPTYLDDPPEIGIVRGKSPAAEADLRFGDRIVSIAGEQVPTWKDVELRVLTSGGQRLKFAVERGGTIFEKEIEVRAEPPSDQGYLGVGPYMPFVIQKLSEGFPAEEAGLRPGDELLSAQQGEHRVEGYLAISQLVSSSADRAVEFLVGRNGATLTESIVPRYIEEEKRAIIGAFPAGLSRIEQFGFFRSFQHAIEQNVEVTALLFKVLGGIITGQTSVKSLSGPIDIAKFSGMAAAQGATTLITFMAFISLQLGILNLLPIPILDGGVIAMLTVEGLIGRDLSLKVKERILQAGFIFLVLLMSFVIFNDISKLL